jgi:ABC-type polysaccharide transport system permease subunit
MYIPNAMYYRIVERSWIARIARFFFGSRQIAMVLGNTIHLSGVEKQVFLSNRKWLIHELVHIEQFRKYGYWKFLFLYLVESIRKGYYHNRFEIEARNAEELAIL